MAVIQARPRPKRTRSILNTRNNLDGLTNFHRKRLVEVLDDRGYDGSRPSLGLDEPFQFETQVLLKQR